MRGEYASLLLCVHNNKKNDLIAFGKRRYFPLQRSQAFFVSMQGPALWWWGNWAPALGRKLLYNSVRIGISCMVFLPVHPKKDHHILITITLFLIASNSLDLNGIKPCLVSYKRQFHATTYLAIQTQTPNAEFWFLAQMMVQQLFKQPSASKRKYSFTGSDCRANRWVSQAVM